MWLAAYEGNEESAIEDAVDFTFEIVARKAYKAKYPKFYHLVRNLADIFESYNIDKNDFDFENLYIENIEEELLDILEALIIDTCAD